MIRLRWLTGAVIAIAVTCGAVTVTASADIPTPDPAITAPSYGALITQSTFLHQQLDQSGGVVNGGRGQRGHRHGKRRGRLKSPTAGQLRALRFVSTPAVSAAVNQYFVAHFAAPGAAPADVTANLDRFRLQFYQQMREAHFSPQNLADVVAYGALLTYSYFNHKTELSDRDAVAVRQGFRHALASSRAILRRSNARKQGLAEILLLRIAYSIAWANTLDAQGDFVGSDEWQEKLRKFIKGVYGFDPEAVRLTRQGLVS